MYDIDKSEFNSIVSSVMESEINEWAKQFQSIQINVDKNVEMIKSADHYQMLIDQLMKKWGKLPDQFFYSKDDDEDVRIKAITDYAQKSAFASFTFSMSQEILKQILGRYSPDNDTQKGFNNFVNSYFACKRNYDYLYENCPQFKDFDDTINDVDTLTRLCDNRDNDEFQKKFNVIEDKYLQALAKDAFFCDTCLLMRYAKIFHNSNIKKESNK